MIKAITFDLDMTLIDLLELKKEASKSAAKAMVKAGLRMNVKTAEKRLFDLYFNQIESNTIFSDFLKKEKLYDDKIVAAAINAYLISKYKNMKPYPGVKKVLGKLRKKGIKLAIVSDAPRLKALMRLDAMGIAKYFDFVVGFEDTRRHKPSKLPFKTALKKLGVLPKEAMHVGDWPDKDILGAKKVGMKSCLAKYGGGQGKKTIKADYEIDKPEDLLNIV